MNRTVTDAGPTFFISDISPRQLGSCGRQRQWRAGLGLGAILLIAAAVRFYAIGREALWTDEAASLRAAGGGWYDVLRQYHEYENTPPLYYLMLHGVGAAFGTASDAIVRAPSALLGILAVGLTWFLAKRCASTSPNDGELSAGPALAAGLVAVSIQQVYFSQEARAYAMFAAMAAVSSLCLLRAIERPTLGRYAAYVFASIAMNYTHFAAAGVLIAQFACGTMAVWRRAGLARIAFGTSQMAIAIATLPLLPTVLKTRGRMIGLDERSLASAVERFAGTFIWLCGNGWLLLPVGFLILWGLLRSRTEMFNKALLLGLMVFPPLVPILGWYTGGAQYFARHALPSGLAMAIAASVGLMALPRRWQWPVAGLLLVAACYSFGTSRQVLRKPAMREAAAFVAENARPGDTVVVSFMMAGWSFDRYFDRKDIRRRNYDEFTIKHVASAGEGINRVWVVFNPILPDESVVFRHSPLRIVRRKEFYDIHVFELERPQ